LGPETAQDSERERATGPARGSEQVMGSERGLVKVTETAKERG
jgi:hypothetical protein